jgi:hypothetical protein
MGAFYDKYHQKDDLWSLWIVIIAAVTPLHFIIDNFKQTFLNDKWCIAPIDIIALQDPTQLLQ